MAGLGMASTSGATTFLPVSHCLCRARWPPGRNGGRLPNQGWRALKGIFGVRGSLWNEAGNATIGTCRFKAVFGVVPPCSWRSRPPAPGPNTCAVECGPSASPPGLFSPAVRAWFPAAAALARAGATSILLALAALLFVHKTIRDCGRASAVMLDGIRAQGIPTAEHQSMRAHG